MRKVICCRPAPMLLCVCLISCLLFTSAAWEMNSAAFLEVPVRGFLTSLQNWTPCVLRGESRGPDVPTKFTWEQYKMGDVIINQVDANQRDDVCRT